MKDGRQRKEVGDCWLGSERWRTIDGKVEARCFNLFPLIARSLLCTQMQSSQSGAQCSFLQCTKLQQKTKQNVHKLQCNRATQWPLMVTLCTQCCTPLWKFYRKQSNIKCCLVDITSNTHQSNYVNQSCQKIRYWQLSV